MTLYKNAFIFQGKKGFIRGALQVSGDRIAKVIHEAHVRGDGTDLQGMYVIPGLVDIHTHGNSGSDFSDGDAEGLRNMGCYYARHGITSFAPASMTLPYDTLETAFINAKSYAESREDTYSRLAGIHMEGPFFSEKKKGAQNAAYLRMPDFVAFKKLYENCGGLIRIVDLAPELPGAADFAEKAAELCTVSVAHTDASYEEARAVYAAGATHLTHLFNAMPSIHHRRPGVIGAASENENVYAELICDGQHVHESAVRMAFKLFPGRICLISDALRCCGMPDGQYELGGQDVFLKGGIARLADGTIAGSAATLTQCLQNALAFGIDRDEAIRAATLNPARQLGCADRYGSIAVGMQADFLVCGESLELRSVYIGGKKID